MYSSMIWKQWTDLPQFVSAYTQNELENFFFKTNSVCTLGYWVGLLEFPSRSKERGAQL